MFKEMSLNVVSFDAYSGEPLIVLKDVSQTKSFLVSGDNQDIRYLMSEFSGTLADISSPFSLILSLVSKLDTKVTRLEIVSENFNHVGYITLTMQGKYLVARQVCRPIDTVILASKLSLPIHVESKLLDQIETRYQPEESVEEKLLSDPKRNFFPNLGGDEKDLLC